MQKQVITLTLRWPNRSCGFDCSQISGHLFDYLKSYDRKPRLYDCGSGRKLKIEKSKVTTVSRSNK